MIDAPMLIIPAGFRGDITRAGRDSDGRRVETTWKCRDDTGRIGGFEHRPATTMGTAGKQHAAVAPATVVKTLRASEFGLTVPQMRDLLATLGARLTPPKPRSGLILHGGNP